MFRRILQVCNRRRRRLQLDQDAAFQKQSEPPRCGLPAVSMEEMVREF
jgi:hypothetical protein